MRNRGRPTFSSRNDVVSQGVVQDVDGLLRSHLDDIDQDFLSETEANRLMAGAFQKLERQLHRPVLSQTKNYMWSGIPVYGAAIRQTPVVEIEAVQYFDADFAEHTIDADTYVSFGLGDYVNIGQPAAIYPKGEYDNGYGGWRIDNGTEFNGQPYPFRVRARVGWQMSDMPPALQQGAMMIATDWFTQKMSGTAAPMYRVKNDVRAIVSQYSHNHTQVF